MEQQRFPVNRARLQPVPCLLSDLPAQAGWLEGAESLLHNRRAGLIGCAWFVCHHTDICEFF